VKNLPLNKMNENGGTKHTGVPVKTLKKLLKKAGLKVSGKKATLTRRAKKARLLKGGLFDMFKSKKIEPITPVEVPRKMSDTELAFYNSKEQVDARAEQAKQQEERKAALEKANRLNAQLQYEREQNVRHSYNAQTGKLEVLGGKNKRSRRR
jgi:hypothetical protein